MSRIAGEVDISVGAHMQLNFGHLAHRVPTTLRPNRGFFLSGDWQILLDAAAEAKTEDQWVIMYHCICVSAVTFAGMVATTVNLYIDGSFFRRDNKAGWAFIVVKEVLGGLCVLEGFAAGAIYEEYFVFFHGDRLDNIAVASISIFAALGYLLKLPRVHAVVHYDFAPAGKSASGLSTPPANVAQVTQVRMLISRSSKPIAVASTMFATGDQRALMGLPNISDDVVVLPQPVPTPRADMMIAMVRKSAGVVAGADEDQREPQTLRCTFGTFNSLASVTFLS